MMFMLHRPCNRRAVEEVACHCRSLPMPEVDAEVLHEFESAVSCAMMTEHSVPQFTKAVATLPALVAASGLSPLHVALLISRPVWKHQQPDSDMLECAETLLSVACFQRNESAAKTLLNMGACPMMGSFFLWETNHPLYNVPGSACIVHLAWETQRARWPAACPGDRALTALRIEKMLLGAGSPPICPSVESRPWSYGGGGDAQPAFVMQKSAQLRRWHGRFSRGLWCALTVPQVL